MPPHPPLNEALQYCMSLDFMYLAKQYLDKYGKTLCLHILLFQDSASAAQQHHQRFSFTTDMHVNCFSLTQNTSFTIQAKVFHPSGVACMYKNMQISSCNQYRMCILTL